MDKAQVWTEECTRTSGWTRVGGKFMDEESEHDWETQGALEWIWNKDLFLQQMLIELLVLVGRYSMYWRHIAQDRNFLFLRRV